MAVVTALGVIGAYRLEGSALLDRAWLLMGVAGLIGALSMWLRSARAMGAALLIALAIFVTGWTAARSFSSAPSDLSSLLGEGERVIVLEGIALTRARVPVRMARGALARFDHRPLTPLFLFEARRLHVAPDGSLPSTAPERTIAVRGRFWAHTPGDAGEGVRAGMGLRIRANAASVRGPTNPGQRDFRPAAREEGFAGHLEIPSRSLIEQISIDSGLERVRASWWTWREAARERALRPLALHDERDAGRALLAALLLGEREASLRPLRASFTRLGLTHLLAISGLNIVLFAGTLSLLVRSVFVLAAVPLRAAWRLEPTIVSVAVAVYLALLPVEPSILRAGLMTLALLLPPVFGRMHDRVNTLAWSFVAIVLVWPSALFTIGLQLSFGVVLALLTLATPFRDRLFGASADPGALGLAGRIARSFQTASAGAIVAWAVSAPCVALHTGIVTPLAAPATLLAAAPVSALSALGYLALGVSPFWEDAGAWCVSWLGGLGNALAGAAALTDRIPWAVIRVPWMSSWLAAGLTAVIVWWLMAPSDALTRWPRRWRVSRLAMSALIVTWAGAAWGFRGLGSDVTLRVDALDVGDGSCLLVRDRGGGAALWDAGGSSFDLGVLELPNALRSLGAKGVHDVFVTHANLDHFNALPDLLHALPVRRLHTTRHFLRAAEQDPDGPEAETLRHAHRLHIKVLTRVAGDVVALGGSHVRVLWPPADLPADAPDNESSLVARVERDGNDGIAAVLLTGDIQSGAMRALLGEPDRLRATVLEAPHHGSASSMPTSLEFVRTVGASVVLQSTGPSRVGDARWDEARGPETRWLVTARRGAVWCEILEDGRVRTGTVQPP